MKKPQNSWVVFRRRQVLPSTKHIKLFSTPSLVAPGPRGFQPEGRVGHEGRCRSRRDSGTAPGFITRLTLARGKSNAGDLDAVRHSAPVGLVVGPVELRGVIGGH